MGTDYASRHSAKKKRKLLRKDGAVDVDELDGVQDEEEKAGKKRERRKRPKVRRFCKGMCYQDPGEALEGETVPPSLAKQDDEESDEAPKKQRRRGKNKNDKASGQSVKLSTASGLSDFTPSQGSQDGAAAPPEQLQGIPDNVKDFLRSQGMTSRTPVQERCWPVIAKGHDAQVLAPTGSGKTLGFLIPMLQKLQASGGLEQPQPPGKPLALVLAPTREVAQQTARAARSLRTAFKLRTVTLFGGASKQEQAALLESGPHLLVASPGRLLDLMEDGAVSLGNVIFVALDEADKLLSQGFASQLEQIHEALGLSKGKAKKVSRPLVLAPAKLEEDQSRPRPQVCLFTATMPEAVSSAASKWLRKPKHVSIESGSGTSVSPNVTQVIQVCAEHKKPRKLLKHLKEIYDGAAQSRNPPRVLVFANRVKTVRFVFQAIKEAKFRVAMLHGLRSQPEREEAMTAFRSGKATVLVATDVAGRGLHIRGLPYIVNFDFPTNLDSYVHRVGRTGRLAANGHSFSFFTRSLARLAPSVLELLKSCGATVDPNLSTLAEAWEEAVRNDPELAKITGKGGGSDGEEEEEEEEIRALEGSSNENEHAEAAEAAAEEPEGAPAAADAAPQRTRKRGKALPGRLRKKLAKDKAASTK